jgi:hypothetical protein
MTGKLGTVDAGAGLAAGAYNVDQLHALRMSLNGLRDGISIDCNGHGHASGRIFQRALPGMEITFVHNAA